MMKIFAIIFSYEKPVTAIAKKIFGRCMMGPKYAAKSVMKTSDEYADYIQR